jgi:hypothetical protein
LIFYDLSHHDHFNLCIFFHSRKLKTVLSEFPHLVKIFHFLLFFSCSVSHNHKWKWKSPDGIFKLFYMPLNIVELTTLSIVVFLNFCSVLSALWLYPRMWKKWKEIADRISAGVYGALHDSTLLLISRGVFFSFFFHSFYCFPDI